MYLYIFTFVNGNDMADSLIFRCSCAGVYKWMVVYMLQMSFFLHKSVQCQATPGLHSMRLCYTTEVHHQHHAHWFHKVTRHETAFRKTR